jgi:hypothetical protein
MMRIFFVYIVLVLVQGALCGQKMLLLEKAYKVKPKKYYVGDLLTYQRNDGFNTWHTAHIEEILVDQQAIVIGVQTVPISEIRGIRKARTGLSYLGKQGLVFGVQTLFYSGVALLLDGDSKQARNFAVGGGSLALLTWTSSLAFKYKKKPMGKRYRLRVVEVPVFK